MTPVQITEDRAIEIRDEFADWLDGLSPELPDGPGAVSACYTSLSFGEVFALVTEVLAAREGSRSRPAEAKAGMVALAEFAKGILTATFNGDDVTRDDAHALAERLGLIVNTSYAPGEEGYEFGDDLCERPFPERPAIIEAFPSAYLFERLERKPGGGSAWVEAVSTTRPTGENVRSVLPLYLDVLLPSNAALEPVAEAKAEPVAVPEEWALLPREATQQMYAAWMTHEGVWSERYAAMLAAAPSLCPTKAIES